MTVVRWRGTVPDEVRQAVDPVMERWAWLAPPWCAEIVLWWDANPDDTSNSASVHVEPPYRFFVIRFQPGFLEGPPEDRDEAVAHEIVHALLEPLCRVHKRLRAEIPDDLRGFEAATWEDAMEGVVTDVALRLVDRWRNGPPPTPLIARG